LAEKFGACLYPAGRLCEGKINGDAMSRKECHYGGYHFCDRGKPEVFAARTKPEKSLRKSVISPPFPLMRRRRYRAGKWLEGDLPGREGRLGLHPYFSCRVVREPHPEEATGSDLRRNVARHCFAGHSRFGAPAFEMKHAKRVH
jgi:hypothetical protein